MAARKKSTRLAARGGSPGSDQESSEESDIRVRSDLMERLLEGRLIKKIEQVIDQRLKEHGGFQNRDSSSDFSRAGGSREGDEVRSRRAEGECCSKGEVRAGGDLLDFFDPADKNTNVDRWLAKIDQLGAIHGWSEYERAYFMQAKLKGTAREWYHRLDDYSRTWAEWKASLSEAFPRQHDYAALLVEMLARAKTPGESMTSYYHAKLALCSRCEHSGEKAVSLVIHGLPESIRAGARSVQAKTPQELYTKFLAGLDEDEIGGKRRGVISGGRGYVPQPKFSRMTSPSERPGRRGVERPEEKRMRCYNCQEYTTHLSRDCPKPRMERCSHCRRGGHVATDCPDARREQQSTQAATRAKHGSKKVSTVSSDKVFRKLALFGDGDEVYKVRVFVDTGSQQSLISTECVERLALPKQANDTLLRGFGGGVTRALFAVTLELLIDGASTCIGIHVEALATDFDLSGADVILGQPACTAPGVMLTINNGQVYFNREDPSDLIRV